jgi:3-hydroxyacyl-[acyl-carrier-protein] dehydratase
VRFHLIDRIDAVEAFKSIRARKLTSRSEDYWEEAGGELVMPPPFALEALCQAGTWLIMISTERRQRAALLSVGTVDWHRPVRPGDVLELNGEVSSFGQDTAVVSGTVIVDGEIVLEAKDIMCALIDGETLAADDDMARLQEMLTRSGTIE